MATLAPDSAKRRATAMPIPCCAGDDGDAVFHGYFPFCFSLGRHLTEHAVLVSNDGHCCNPIG